MWNWAYFNSFIKFFVNDVANALLIVNSEIKAYFKNFNENCTYSNTVVACLAQSIPPSYHTGQKRTHTGKYNSETKKGAGSIMFLTCNWMLRISITGSGHHLPTSEHKHALSSCTNISYFVLVQECYTWKLVFLQCKDWMDTQHKVRLKAKWNEISIPWILELLFVADPCTIANIQIQTSG